MNDTTNTTFTAKTFAAAILDMRFSDVMKVVDALNQANSGRKTIDGGTLLAAANLIIDGKVGEIVTPASKPAKPKQVK